MGSFCLTLGQQPCTPCCWNPHRGYFCSFALLLGTVSSQSDNSEYKLFLNAKWDIFTPNQTQNLVHFSLGMLTEDFF